MKRTLYMPATVLLLWLITVMCAGAQESLGAVARQQRQGKRPSAAKVYTNDDFAAVTITSPGDSKAESAKKSEKDDATAAKEEKAKLAADFKAKAEELKKNIAQLQRELDVAQREYRLKVAVYYADVGNNLRDSKKWAEDDRKQRAELEQKQKALEGTKQKLADIQEQARKAGVRVE